MNPEYLSFTQLIMVSFHQVLIFFSKSPACPEAIKGKDLLKLPSPPLPHLHNYHYPSATTIPLTALNKLILFFVLLTGVETFIKKKH